MLLFMFNLSAFAAEYDSIRLDTVKKSGIKSTFLYTKIYRAAPYALPAVMAGYGFLSLENAVVESTDKHIHHEMMEKYRGFHSSLDDKLQYAPAVAVYTLNIIGVKSKNNFIDRSAMYLMSVALAGHTVDIIKKHSGKQRPAGDNLRSFPSGHTANAFAAAEFMRMEYKHVSPWYGLAAYSVASATGTLRLMNNRHWFSDVVAGAGIGILSTKAAYIAYPWLKKTIIGKKDLNFIATPTLEGNTVGLYFAVPLK